MFKFLSFRTRATVIHFLATAAIAGLIASLLFIFWYPGIFREISGGKRIFVILVAIDLVLGPALTALIADSRKTRGQFGRDLFFVVGIQLAALGYGVRTLALARPVLISFEIDRMRVVSAAEVQVESLDSAPPGLGQLSWWGPRLIAAVKPSDPTEQYQSIQLGLAGIDLSMLPRNWRAYSTARDLAWSRSRPVAMLAKAHPAAQLAIEELAREASTDQSGLRFLPLVGGQSSWVAILASGGSEIVGYLPLDGFIDGSAK